MITKSWARILLGARTLKCLLICLFLKQVPRWGASKLLQTTIMPNWQIWAQFILPNVYIADLSASRQTLFRCPNRESCEGVNLQELPSNPLVDSKDYQEIKVQEKVAALSLMS